MMNKPLLSIRDLSIQSGERLLVDGLSMDIFPGTTMGIVGESGSGKTLSALALMQLLPPTIHRSSGSALLDVPVLQDTDLFSLDENGMNRVRGKNIAMIFQEPMTSLNPSMRCGMQVEEGIILHTGCSKKEAREKVLELFNEVRLPDPQRASLSWPHQLSGGQRQRVMIAMALAMNPALLIADEPTTALDVTVQKSILQLLLELQEKHKLSILFISHDLMVIRQLAHNITVMYQGKVVEQGPTENIFNSPASPYTRGLIACKPGPGELPLRLPTISDFIEGKAIRHETKKPLTIIRDTPLLEVRRLNMHYTGKKNNVVKAVDDVSLNLYRGETLGLVGESGCGKTTLGRSILRLVKANSGDIIYKGTALNQLPAKEMRAFRKKMQIVFQDPYSSLNPRMTVGRMLTEAMKVHRLGGSDAQRMKKAGILLEKVGLPVADLNRYPHQFSGGQRQRIGIARALATEPEFIVLDESVSALDVSVQAQVLNLLNELKEEFGLTYIFISHDLGVIRYMADRVLVMRSGKLVEEAETSELFSHPQTAYTRDLLNAIPR